MFIFLQEILLLNEEETKRKCEEEFTEQIEAVKVNHGQEIAAQKQNHDME